MLSYIKTTDAGTGYTLEIIADMFLLR